MMTKCNKSMIFFKAVGGGVAMVAPLFKLIMNLKSQYISVISINTRCVDTSRILLKRKITN